VVGQVQRGRIASADRLGVRAFLATLPTLARKLLRRAHHILHELGDPALAPAT
jgi:hypothetical protein